MSLDMHALKTTSSIPLTLEALEALIAQLVPEHFNAQQRHAILTPMQHGLKLLAGAGAGKTAVLTRRYVYGLLVQVQAALEAQVPLDLSFWAELAQSQLMITFTDKAAEEMRERVKVLWEDTLALPPLPLRSENLGTIHAFCGALLRQTLPMTQGHCSEALGRPDLGLCGTYPLPSKHYQLVDDIAKRDILLSIKKQWHHGMRKQTLLNLMETWGLSLPELTQWLHACPHDTLSHFHLRGFLPAHDPQKLLKQLEKLLGTLKTLAMTPSGTYQTLKAQQDTLFSAMLKLQVPQSTLNEEAYEAHLPEDLIHLWQNSYSLFPYQSLGLEPLQALEEEDEQKKRLKYWGGFFDTQLLGIRKEAAQRKGRKKTYLWLPPQYQPHYATWMQQQLNRLLEWACCLYAQYQSELLVKNLCDFDDLILLSIIALHTNPSLRQRLINQYKLILVDEFQDTNLAQIRLLQALLPQEARTTPRLTVVGDLRQAIYGFRHAKPNNLNLIFANHDHDMQTLDANYRSQAPIVEAANTLMAEGPLGEIMPDLRHPMIAKAPVTPAHVLSRHKDLRCHVCWLDNQLVKGNTLETALSEERQVITSYIQGLLAQGVSPESIAIIAHSHHKLGRIAYMLEQAGIPFKRQKEKDFFTRPLTQQCLTWCSLLHAPYQPTAWWHVLSARGSSASSMPMFNPLLVGYQEASSAKVMPWATWVALALQHLQNGTPLDAETLATLTQHPYYLSHYPVLKTYYERLFKVQHTLLNASTVEEATEAILTLMICPESLPQEDVYRWRFAMHGILNQQWQASLKEYPLPDEPQPHHLQAPLQRLLERLHIMADAQTNPTPQDHGTQTDEGRETPTDPIAAIDMTLPEDLPGIALLTIHSSKGLEYPYVILPWTETKTTLKKASLRDSVWVVDVQESHLPGFGLFPKQWFAMEHPCYTVWSNLWQRPEQELEAIRLFYVALTRAKEGILWIGLPKTTPLWMASSLEGWTSWETLKLSVKNE
jgi:superfamily I DNA/RNA helicase